jgi:hypothetical protein
MTWLRNLALVSALAVPTLLLPASARAAEASACGDFDFSVVDISECHFEFDGGCEANCTPLSFVAACDGGCNATVTSECTESCSSVCFESCSVDVNFSCAAECEVDCNARASADCSAEPNQAECEAYVVANCESNCDAGCQGTVDLSCEEQCAQCCSTSCSSARKSGWAMEMSASARSRSVLPCRSTAPCSVTTQCTWPRVVTTPAPGFSSATMRETLPPAAVEGSAMMGLPPRRAPRRG